MKVLHVVNAADEQSIPLELALAISDRRQGMVIASFYDRSDHPAVGRAADVRQVKADGAFDKLAIRRLRDLMRDVQPDIVHMHHTVSAFWCTRVAAGMKPRPVLVKTEHNDHRFLPWHQRVINPMVYPFVSRIVCNSDTTLQSFSRLEGWLTKNKRQRIYNGVDLRRVRAHAPSGTRTAPVGNGPVIIGNVGRLVPQKNQRRLIEALALARSQSGRDIRLEIVGDGKLRAELEGAASAAGVAGSVTFCGGIPREEVYQRLYEWDGFVMPSVFEGFCNALVEALAAGLPVAVSAIDTLREVAGTDQLTFDPHDTLQMAEALIRIADGRRDIGAFADRYDIGYAVDKHLELYETLCGVRARGNQAAA